MVNRSDRDPPNLDSQTSFELYEEMRRGLAESIRARRLRPAKQAGYKPAALSVNQSHRRALAIGRRPYKLTMRSSLAVACFAIVATMVLPISADAVSPIEATRLPQDPIVTP